MVVKAVSSGGEYNSEVGKPGFTLVDFFATWCGPCKRIAPYVESLSDQASGTNFIKVDADVLKEVVSSAGVSAFPTFHLYKAGQKIAEMKGANEKGLLAMLEKHGAMQVGGGASGGMPAHGAGQSLGGGAAAWDGVGAPPSAKEQRMSFLANLEAQAPARVPPAVSLPAPPTTTTAAAAISAMTTTQEEEDAEMARAIAMSVEGEEPPAVAAGASEMAATAKQDADDEAEARLEVEKSMEVWDGEEMVPLPVDDALLTQLMSMGFSDCRARKGIHHGTSLDGAVSWIEANATDANIDQPYMVRKKDTIPKVPLTPEEFAAKVEATKNKIARLRKERQDKEKIDQREAERMRRERGKEMANTQEERERLQRKRDIDVAKRQKREEKEEKQRILDQIKADKALRKANGGKLPSALGVDGYAPSILQKDDLDAKGTDVTKANSATAAAPIGPPGPRIDGAIDKISRHRTNGDGGSALKLLVLFLKNIVDKPTEEKYRSINAAGNAFRTKVQPVTGCTILLKACGFVKNDDDKYVLPGDHDATLLKETLQKLVAAEVEFKRLNPA